MMKIFSEHINESIELPAFVHPELTEPNDPDGKFWKMIAAANAESDKAGKTTYTKAIRLAKDLYQLLATMPNDDNIKTAAKSVSDAVTALELADSDIDEEISTQDLKFIRMVLYIIQGIEGRISGSRWYKKSHIDIKAGYVPFRGSAKDPKIKFRMLVKLPDAVTVRTKTQVTKDIMNLSPLHKDYVAGVEWNKELTAFSILFTNSAGYKR